MSVWGFTEASSFGIAAVVAVKSASVGLLGMEMTGNENLIISFAGEVVAM